MAKIYHLDEDLVDKIATVASDNGLENFMNIESMGTKVKEIIKVSRIGAVGEFVSQKQDTVAIVVDEEIYEKLDENDRDMILDDAFCKIQFDSEKDVISVNKTPVITMTLDAWQKYGADLAHAYEKAILIRQQMEEEEKERKQAEKEAKAAKRAQKNA